MTKNERIIKVSDVRLTEKGDYFFSTNLSGPVLGRGTLKVDGVGELLLQNSVTDNGLHYPVD